MKETITIENFGGLKKLEFEIKEITILIGPQASGKSVSIKLIYFFKKFVAEIQKSVENEETKRVLDARQKEKFNIYFPKESWSNDTFKVKYTINNNHILIERKKNKNLTFTYSDNFRDIFNKGRKILREEKKRQQNDIDNPFYVSKVNNSARNRLSNYVIKQLSGNAVFRQFFVPAGRSFFANIQSSIFSFLSNNTSLDPFLIEFGSFYENFKRLTSNFDNKKEQTAFLSLVNEVMNGTFQREKDKDYIVHKDNRKVNLSYASSGQQETLPLVMVLKTLSASNIDLYGATLYIEEPEAHLFPTAQKKIVQLLARTFNSQIKNFQIIITTHSPYILSSFNNLLEAGKIVEEQPEKQETVYEVIPKEEIIHIKDIAAYSIFNGKKKDLIDKETKLISQNVLDEVSEEISIDFGKLLDIEY